jgi:hypothetical protein
VLDDNTFISGTTADQIRLRADDHPWSVQAAHDEVKQALDR